MPVCHKSVTRRKAKGLSGKLTVQPSIASLSVRAPLRLFFLLDLWPAERRVVVVVVVVPEAL